MGWGVWLLCEPCGPPLRCMLRPAFSWSVGSHSSMSRMGGYTGLVSLVRIRVRVRVRIRVRVRVRIRG